MTTINISHSMWLNKENKLDKMKKDKNLKKSLFRNPLLSIESIEDIPEQNQLKVIKSVLNSPVIPLSFKKIHEVMGNQIKLKKEGKDISFEDLPENEREGQHPLTPQFFINLVLSNPRYLEPLLVQTNINTILAKSYEAFVVDSDNPIFDEFKATCQLKYGDVQKLRKMRDIETNNSQDQNNIQDSKV